MRSLKSYQPDGDHNLKGFDAWFESNDKNRAGIISKRTLMQYLFQIIKVSQLEPRKLRIQRAVQNGADLI